MHETASSRLRLRLISVALIAGLLSCCNEADAIGGQPFIGGQSFLSIYHYSYHYHHYRNHWRRHHFAERHYHPAPKTIVHHPAKIIKPSVPINAEKQQDLEKLYDIRRKLDEIP